LNKNISIRSELSAEDRALCKAYSKNKVNILGTLKEVATPKKPAPDLSSITFHTENYLNPRDLDLSDSSLGESFDIKYSSPSL